MAYEIYVSKLINLYEVSTRVHEDLFIFHNFRLLSLHLIILQGAEFFIVYVFYIDKSWNQAHVFA